MRWTFQTAAHHLRLSLKQNTHHSGFYCLWWSFLLMFRPSSSSSSFVSAPQTQTHEQVKVRLDRAPGPTISLVPDPLSPVDRTCSDSLWSLTCGGQVDMLTSMFGRSWDVWVMCRGAPSCHEGAYRVCNTVWVVGPHERQDPTFPSRTFD